VKIIIVVALVAVVAALFTALVFLHRDRGRGQRVVAALAVRVVLSAALIAFLVLSYRMGWITPGR
jgi:heme/copper-type cytochrome/quinol oxidase subunit 4